MRRLVIAAILAIAIGAPIVEAFDSWDQTARDGSDTEANAAIAALCIGVALAVGTMAVAARLRALASTSRLRSITPRNPPLARLYSWRPVPTVSPPTPLRV